jgi:predicted MPP superfamily phosphohydrolase
MAHSFDSVPEDDPLIRSPFHHLLVAFAAPAQWPAWQVYLLVGALALVPALAWVALSGAWREGLLVFLLQASFYALDCLLLADLPRRRLSFGPWQSQILALALPRCAATVVLGLLIPLLGRQPAFFLTLTAQLLGTLALYRGALIEPDRLSLSEVSAGSDRLPDGAAVRILHISDLHVERLGKREERVLELARAARPDVILITGDYVNISFNVDPATHAQVRELLGRLSAPGGVYAVPGSPAVDLPDVVPPLVDEVPTVRLLRDEAVTIGEPAGRALTLIGLDCHHDIAADTARLDKILASVADHYPRVLLYHSPDLMPAAVTRGIDLYLCGHTHGGQVRLPLIGPLLTSSKLGRRYVMGHYQEGRTHLYVSRGVGFEGLAAPRVRLFCPPEIALVTLTSNERRT